MPAARSRFHLRAPALPKLALALAVAACRAVEPPAEVAPPGEPPVLPPVPVIAAQSYDPQYVCLEALVPPRKPAREATTARVYTRDAPPTGTWEAIDGVRVAGRQGDGFVAETLEDQRSGRVFDTPGPDPDILAGPGWVQRVVRLVHVTDSHVSAWFGGSDYAHGAAHANNDLACGTWSRHTGARLSLADLVGVEEAARRIGRGVSRRLAPRVPPVSRHRLRSPDLAMTIPERIARLTGRPFPRADCRPVDHLYALSPETVAQARALGDPELARAYLVAFTTPGARPYLRAFVREVVLGGVPHDRWARGRVYAIQPDFVALLTLPRAALLGPIGGTMPARRPVDRARWEAFRGAGTPVLVDEEADYTTRFDARPGAVAYSMRPTEAVTDETVAVRRWTAGMLARFALARGVPLLASNAHMFGVDPGSWTEDARAGWAGLLREAATLGPATGADVPGFRGDDAWYR